LLGPVPLSEFITLGDELVHTVWLLPDLIIRLVIGGGKLPARWDVAMDAPRQAIRALVDRVRELDRDGQLTAHQRALPFVRRVLADAATPGGGYHRLAPLLMPLLIAGHETTGHSLAWGLYELARTPALEAQLLEEIEVSRAACGGQPLTTAQ